MPRKIILQKPFIKDFPKLLGFSNKVKYLYPEDISILIFLNMAFSDIINLKLLIQQDFSMIKKILKKFLSNFYKYKATVNSLEYEDFPVEFNDDALKIKEPVYKKFNPVYVLVRFLNFQPIVKLNEMQQFKNLIKWLFVNMDFMVVFRDYPLELVTKLNKYDKEKVALKVERKLKFLEQKQINISKNIKITEEIIHVQPYTRSVKKQKLFRLPISRTPLFKSYFSSEQLRQIREDLAKQNDTRWSNVEILEIYDKFNSKLFADIKQTSGSRNLLCYPSYTNAGMDIEDKMYFLIIGKRRDTGELVKSLAKAI